MSARARAVAIQPCLLSPSLLSLTPPHLAAVTKARQSFPRSVSGRLLVFGVFACSVCTTGLFVFVTSPLWVPVALASSSFYVGAHCSRMLATQLRGAWIRLKHWGAWHLKMLLHPPPPAVNTGASNVKMQQRAAAMSDRGFMRNIFEGLPGVDTDYALEKIDAWKDNTLDASPIALDPPMTKYSGS